MLQSAIGALGGRVDSKFLMAYWVPAFVLALGGLAILSGLVGFEQIDTWVSGRDSVEQSIGALAILLLISMLAFVLYALTRPISEVFAGAALPRAVANWSAQGQARTKVRAAHLLNTAPQHDQRSPAAMDAARWLDLRFPSDDADLQPTLFGNVVASAAEHPWRAYSMNGALWSPRLAPLLPAAYKDSLASAQAPMLALLNLCVVFLLLVPASVLTLGSLGDRWTAAIVAAVGLLVASRLCYRAAMAQAVQVGSLLRIAFDLYRYDILDQLGLEHPSGLDAERALWLDLTDQILGVSGSMEPAAGNSAAGRAPASPILPAAAPADAPAADPAAQT